MIEFLKAIWEKLEDCSVLEMPFFVMLIMLPVAYIAIRAGWSAWFVIITSVVIWAGIVILMRKARG